MSAYALERLQSLPQDIVFMPVTTRMPLLFARVRSPQQLERLIDTKVLIVVNIWNSVEITLIGTGLSMAVTIMAAYPLSRRHFYHRRFFTMAMVFTMIFNGGLIPTYYLPS